MNTELARDILDASNWIFREALTCDTREQVAGVCLAAAERLTGSRFGFICEVNPRGRFDTIAISDTGWSACRIADGRELLMAGDLEIRGIRGRVINEGRSLRFNDPAGHPDWIQPPEGHPPIKSFMGIPLRHGGRILGMIGLANKESGYTEVDQRIVEELSASFCVALVQKWAHESLEEKERYYRSMLHNMHEDILIINREYRIVDANNSYLRSTGHTREEVVGRPCYEVTHGFRDRCDRFGEPCPFKDIFDTGEARKGVYRHLRKDGTRAYVDVIFSPLKDSSGRTTHIIKNIRDITELRKAEEKLSHQAGLLQNVSDAVISMDTEFRVQSWNRAAMEMYGWKESEVAGKMLDEVVEPKYSETTGEEVARSILANGSWQGEVIHHHRSGHILHVFGSITQIRDAEGNPTGAVAVNRDITEQKGLEDQLRQSQKMQAVGRLAGGIAHDFNNLLTIINGYTDMVMAKLGEENGLRSDLKEIKEAGLRAARLTSQLLAFSKKQVMRPVVLNLNDVVRNLEKMLQRIIGEDITLVTELEDSLHPVKVDRSQVEQVLLNLAVNSRDAMPGGGKLCIATRNVLLPREDPGLLDSAPAGRYAAIAISDTGCGMREEVRTRVFEPFFTTKRKGTGLGLSTVYGIVKQSGGTVDVDSEPGKGTRFSICLPSTEEEETPSTDTQRGKSVDPGAETVLVVEDDDVVRTLVRKLLKETGYRVLEASSGAEALQLTAEKGGKAGHIDLLLTDVVMPGMSGPELLNRLGSRFPDMRVCFMSGYTDETLGHHGALDPSIPIIEKPFETKTLVRQIREVLDSE
jgi:PAS domain S-box-containing protein